MIGDEINLTLLRSTCETVLKEGRATPGVEGPINWGDLHCVAALRCEDDQGDVSYRVEIEEAAPDNEVLARFVHQRLTEEGFPGVEVYTEW